MSEFTVTVRAEALLARLTNASQRLHDNLLRAVDRLSIDVQAAVKTDKLSGQVLHNRTGTLRRSINRVIVDNKEGVLARVGTNVRSAHIHEYGFDGIVSVREHVRRSAVQMAVKRSKRVSKAAGEITVRAHTMHMRMPERSFLRSVLRERTTEINTKIRQAVREALQP